jgi:hypothetical protein
MRAIGRTLLAGAAVLLAAGCKIAEEELRSLDVEPGYKELSGLERSFKLTAHTSGPLGLPLEWYTMNPAIGDIVSASGSNAVYARGNDSGENVIIVKDAYDAEGYATVVQE